MKWGPPLLQMSLARMDGYSSAKQTKGVLSQVSWGLDKFQRPLLAQHLMILKLLVSKLENTGATQKVQT
jgi:hypothetical protein